ncbi:MAG: protein-glutamate O-methyltransferase CheR [Ectothiorhodospiraceae bacterium]|nr:protein-glutamate O-methyltransferase CheR [Ectothiorhodospiraceae bacterium]
MVANSAVELDSGLAREFHFTGADFRFIRDLVADRTGIMLSENKKDLVYGRLARRLRELRMTRFRDYCDLLQKGHDEEMVNFVNAITTNLTSFFREDHHFDYLAKKLIPTLVEKKIQNKDAHRIRIWSAGCSTGEEPYSIAMVVNEVMEKYKSWDVRILATDLDTKVLEKASNGIYEKSRVEGLSKTRLRRWINSGNGANEGMVRMTRELRDLITFKQLNLMNDWPMKGPFDLIFCRNVVIYFNKPTQQKLFDRYAGLLDENGHLFLGHSETMFKKTERYQLIGKTIYQKKH